MKLVVLILATLATLSVMADTSYVGEEQTTRRVGDREVYRVWCDTAELMTAVATAPPPQLPDRCYVSPPGYVIGARLVRWVSGPYVHGGMSASVWEVQDEVYISQRGLSQVPPGPTSFVMLRDDGGEHEAGVAL